MPRPSQRSKRAQMLVELGKAASLTNSRYARDNPVNSPCPSSYIDSPCPVSVSTEDVEFMDEILKAHITPTDCPITDDNNNAKNNIPSKQGKTVTVNDRNVRKNLFPDEQREEITTAPEALLGIATELNKSGIETSQGIAVLDVDSSDILCTTAPVNPVAITNNLKTPITETDNNQEELLEIPLNVIESNSSEFDILISENENLHKDSFEIPLNETDGNELQVANNTSSSTTDETDMTAQSPEVVNAGKTVTFTESNDNARKNLFPDEKQEELTTASEALLEIATDLHKAGVEMSQGIAVLDLDSPDILCTIKPVNPVAITNNLKTPITETDNNQEELLEIPLNVIESNSSEFDIFISENENLHKDSFEITLNETDSNELHSTTDETDMTAQSSEVVNADVSKSRRKRRAASPLADDTTPKKRTRNQSQWKTTKVKEARARGEEYVSLRGKHVAAKQLGPGCTESCAFKCHSKVPENERQLIFKRYYEIKQVERKWDYIGRLVKTCTIARRTTDEDFSRRKKTLKYFLHLSDDSKVQVCKKFFLDTIAQSEQVVRTAVEKQQGKSGLISPDKRGKFKSKTPAGSIIKNNVKAHISSFKPVESHYCRKNSKCKYLPQSLNVRKMHTMYVLSRGEKTPHTATYRQYSDIFRTEFNLKFQTPKKDQCSQCLNWKNKTAEEKGRGNEQEKFDQHIQNKKKGQELKEKDSNEAKINPEICVLSMDFQQILLCPKGANAEFYYKSKLKCFNFSVFEHTTKQGHCYVWDQTLACKGATEVCSCMFNFIAMKAESGIKKIIIYSDNCWSQNKNKLLFSMYNMLSFKYNIEITHRYLEKGHTHMEVDSMHALIERTSRNIDVFTPSQWYAIMKAAKKTAPRYRVVEMTQNDFKKFDEVASHHNWSKLSVSKIREIHVYQNEVQFKNNYDDDPTKISIFPLRSGRPVKWDTFKLKNAYPRKLVIPKNPLDDLKEMVKKGNIPSAYTPFYEHLFIEQASLLEDDRNEDDAVDSCEDGCETCEEDDE